MVPPRITKMNCLAWNRVHYYNFLRILAPKKKERKCSGQKSKVLSAFFKVSKNSLGNLYWDKIYTRATWINLIWMPLSLIRIYCSHCWPWIFIWYGVAICFPFHGLMAILDLHVKMRAQQLMRITEISSDGR